MLAPIGMPVRGLARRGHIARGPSRAQTVPYIHNMPTLCISLRYIWVFVACILLKKAGDRFGQEYKFTKGEVPGAWCLFVTLACCVFGKYSEGPSP